MKYIIYTFCVVTLLMPIMSIPADAAGKSPGKDVPVFADNDGDGVNDAFRDADGDGVNDVSGKAYLHRFSFKDADNDGVNDVFRDADGDGINDLIEADKVKPGNPGYLHYIDYDDDGINDVTGEVMRGPGKHVFVDEDGDGIDDNVMSNVQGQGHAMRGRNADQDEFLDEDSDGINDGRGFERYQRRKGKQNADETNQNHGKNR